MAATPVRAAILVHMGGKHLKKRRMCMFVLNRACPVPEDEMDPDYCIACSSWASIILQKLAMESQKEMVEVMKQEGLYDLGDDERRDDEWWYR